MTQKDCPLMVPCDDLRKTSDVLTDVRLQLREVVTELKGINEWGRKIDSMEKLLTETVDSTKEAHKRIDGISKILFWIGTTTGGAAIVATVTFVIRGGLVQ